VGLVSEGDLLLWALVVLPVPATVSLGMLARAFVAGGGGYWVVWGILLVALCVMWVLAYRVAG
jgi:hypothetical protein